MNQVIQFLTVSMKGTQVPRIPEECGNIVRVGNENTIMLCHLLCSITCCGLGSLRLARELLA